MKAVAVLPEIRETRIVENDDPDLLSPTQVKLRILDVGVCGTDREICAFDYGTPPPLSEYLIIGHEALGEVIEVGSAVSRVKPGDLVVPMVRRPCSEDHCLACRSGRQDFCYTGQYTERGIKQAHGFMTEFVIDEEKYMNIVPRELRDVAVLVEPLTIAEKALAQIRQIQQRLPWYSALARGERRGQRAVVIGAGPVGLLGAMALVAAGFDTYVYSRESNNDPRAGIVESFEAKYISSETHSVEDIADEVGCIDLIYEAVGVSRISFNIMKALGPNGVFVFTGVPGHMPPVEVDTDQLMRNLVLKNQVVFGTVNAGRDDFEAAIGDLSVFTTRWPDAVRALITGRFPIEAYADLLLTRQGGIKNVITFYTAWRD
jgi:threonine dehydrogenase-like Zn-dependent dehydrogenase